MPATIENKKQTRDKGEIKRILVAVDGSEDATKAAEIAIVLAKKFGSEIVVCHAIPTPPYAFRRTVSAALVSEYFSSARKEAKQFVNDMVKLAEAKGVNATELILDQDSVVEAIVKNAEASNIDMIVIGTRGQSGFKKLVMGSVSSGVLSHAHCSVLVVR